MTAAGKAISGGRLIFVHDQLMEAGFVAFRPAGPGGLDGPDGPDIQDEGDEMDGLDELDETDDKAKPPLTFSRYQF
jgi:hypothetical protein